MTISAIIFAGLLSLAQMGHAVRWLCLDEYTREQAVLGVRWGSHELLNDPQRIEQIAQAAIDAGLANNVDPLLVLAVAWRESRLLAEVSTLSKRGQRGELGLLQLTGAAKRGCNLNTIAGQFDCGAKWLRAKIDECNGDEIGGLSLYMTGKSCRHIDPAERRHQLYQTMRKVVSDGTND